MAPWSWATRRSGGEEEQRRRRRDEGMSLRASERVNWAVLAGGAVATVLSLAFSKRRRRNLASDKKILVSSQCTDTPSSESRSVDAEVISFHPESSTSTSGSEGDNHMQDHQEDSPVLSETSSLPASTRDAIRKLRQQLKNRDEMIMEMQIQLADKDRKLCSHKSLITNLEGQLRDANDSIFQVEKVIHDVTPAADGFRLPSSSPTASSPSVDKGQQQNMVQQAKHLEAELLGIRAMACEMASLLEVSERERLRLHNVVSQLQQKLVFQAKELHTMKAMCLAESPQHLQRIEDDQLLELYSSVDSYLQARVYPVEDEVSSGSLEQESPVAKTDRNWSFEEVQSSPSSNDKAEEKQTSRYNDSPAVVIGSPTVPGSQSLDTTSTGARRYLFDADEEEDSLLESNEELVGQEGGETGTGDSGLADDGPALQDEDGTTLHDEDGPILQADPEGSATEAEGGTSSDVASLDEMLDHTLDDLVKVSLR